jgi:hypothetical protein
MGIYYSGVGETIAVLGRVDALSLEAAFLRPSSRMTYAGTLTLGSLTELSRALA